MMLAPRCICESLCLAISAVPVGAAGTQETGSTAASLVFSNLHFFPDVLIAAGLCVSFNRPAPHLFWACSRACCPACFVWSNKSSNEHLAYDATSHLSEISDQRRDRA